MADPLPTGAYVIRNKVTGMVLHMNQDDFVAVAHDHDPNRHREQQIWWVEALPDYEDVLEKGGTGVYSISNIPTNRSLDSKGSSSPGSDVLAFDSHGELHQKWRIRRVEDDQEGEFYRIISVRSGGVLDIKGDNPSSGTKCFHAKPDDKSHQQHWEFLIPVVAVPPGWVQIRNISSELFLQQTYFTSPPFLAPPTPNHKALNLRENWGMQWSFIVPPQHKTSTPHSSWAIQNRLTRMFLSNQVELYKDTIPISVHATWSCSSSAYKHWMLEINRDGYWKIKNKSSQYLLEQGSALDKCKDSVKCVRKSTTENSDSEMWEILSSSRKFADKVSLSDVFRSLRRIIRPPKVG